MIRARNFTFTRNNPGTNHEEDKIDCKYVVYGNEVGALGTPHRQGTIIFKSVKSKEQAIKSLPGCHVDICKFLHQSIAYCKKDGDFVERGDAPLTPKEKGKKGGEAEQERWQNIIDVARKGPDAWEELPASDRVKYDRFMEREYDRETKKRKFETLSHSDKDTPNIWCYGPTGTGKSRLYRDMVPPLRSAGKSYRSPQILRWYPSLSC